ncbi:phosphonate C-P lyase system protein PhnH [Salinarchaeum chitinilyticum]
MRALGLDPVHDTQTTFRALCDATSRPGTVVELDATPADHAVVATLVDHEVTTWTDDDRLRSALESEGRLEEAPATAADVVHTRGVPEWDVRDCVRGSLVEPSQGATVVYRVETIVAVDDAPVESALDADLTTIELSGPGVDGTRRVATDLPASEFEALADAQSTYPRGVDAYFATAEQLTAIPRSGELEVA